MNTILVEHGILSFNLLLTQSCACTEDLTGSFFGPSVLKLLRDNTGRSLTFAIRRSWRWRAS
jgi:hypothetical protein